MGLRVGFLRALYASPRIPGRDRFIGSLTDSFAAKPALLPSGLRMFLNPNEWVQQEILIRGTTEPLTINLFWKLAHPGTCVVDVGAQVGFHALKAARAVGANGRVLAFDPQPYNADRIGRHAVLNDFPHLLTFCAAVGDQDGLIKLPIQTDRDRARLSLHEAGPSDEYAFVEVPLRWLDTVFPANGVGQVQLLKIDVEGYELEVLRGVRQRIGECRNIVREMLETTDARRNREVVDLLTDAGFDLRDVTGKPWQYGKPLVEQYLWAAQL